MSGAAASEAAAQQVGGSSERFFDDDGGLSCALLGILMELRCVYVCVAFVSAGTQPVLDLSSYLNAIEHRKRGTSVRVFEPLSLLLAIRLSAFPLSALAGGVCVCICVCVCFCV